MTSCKKTIICNFLTLSPTLGPRGSTVTIGNVGNLSPLAPLSNLFINGVQIPFRLTLGGAIAFVIPPTATIGQNTITLCIPIESDKDRHDYRHKKDCKKKCKIKCNPCSPCTTLKTQCCSLFEVIKVPSSPPTIISLSPTAGPVGTVVTITGTNFAPGSTVTINGISGIVPTTITSTTITFVIPPGLAPGTYTVTVVGPNGVSNTATFTVTAGPPPPATALCIDNSTDLGQFAVLGASAVTNTGATVVSSSTSSPGDVGVSPGTSITGFPPGVIVTGTQESNTALAISAQAQATTLFGTLASDPCTVNLTGIDLGGLTLTPGVYCFDSSAQLTGTLTLNGLGNPASSFIFRTGSALTTASGSNIVLINGAQACNVFFRVGSSATLGSGSTFNASIVALTSISVNNAVAINGRLVALNGAVTLINDMVNIPVCSTCT